jgi:hypothetical protein
MFRDAFPGAITFGPVVADRSVHDRPANAAAAITNRERFFRERAFMATSPFDEFASVASVAASRAPMANYVIRKSGTKRDNLRFSASCCGQRFEPRLFLQVSPPPRVHFPEARTVIGMVGEILLES